MHQFIDYISSVLSGFPVSAADNRWMTTLIAVAASIMFAWIIYQLLNRVVGKYILRFVEYTAVTWDDILFNRKVLRSVWRFVLSILLLLTLPGAFSLYAGWERVITSICQIMVVLATMMIVVRLVSSLHEIILDTDRFRDHSLKGVFQMIQLMVIVVGVIIVISIIIHRDPIYILSGLGAAAAIIMLVFQDTILGLVAGIQLSANDMLRPGDWISAPKYNVNGIVREVTLTTVKVQNYDNTIITMPPYSLVKDSFQNWRGMFDAGGRRIMRSINIDMTTIRRASAAEMAELDREPWMTPELREELGPRPVNMRLLRAYVKWSIQQVPTLRADLTSMVRELQPTADGLPLEVYFFTSSTDWVSYERIQADFFDELLATVNRFGLRIFQHPTGADIRSRLDRRPLEELKQ